jgi:hypothetical protein
VSAKKNSPQYTVIIAVDIERASKSKRESLRNGLFLAVRIKKSTKTRRIIRA